MEYLIASDKEMYAAAATLFREYSEWLQADLCFQQFEKELQDLAAMYGVADGGIILCRHEGTYIGCSAIRRIDADTCELKRMWVKPGFQNKGIGENLLRECLKMARSLFYQKVKLDTLERLQPAVHLYKKYGFVETTAYYPNPLAQVVYMELSL